MYIGASLVLFGEAVLFEYFAAFVYAVGVFVFFHLFVILYEEPTLRRKFGESYQRYCKSVPRWIPGTIHPLAPTTQSQAH
jgi:protein-S-isoprenylcysteine O-methyltransferase Ste14